SYSGLASPPRLTGAPLEVDELRELRQHADIHPVRMLRNHLAPAAGDANHAPLRTAQQPCLIHVSNSPAQPVSKQRRPAWRPGTQVILGQVEPLSEHRTKLSPRMIAAIGKDAQRRRHQ